MNNLPKSSESDQTSRLVLTVKGVGVVPTKKNRFFPGANGHVLIDKETKVRIQRLEKAIECLLRSAIQTSEGEILMGRLPPRWMRLLTQSPPFDDNWQQIPELIVKGEKCEPGDEGVTITIERIG